RQSNDTGHFVFRKGLKISVETAEQQAYLETFLEEFAAVTTWKPKVVVGGDAPFQLSTNNTLPAEGYSLEVKPATISIRAGDKGGFLYALQTLRQLFAPDYFSGQPQPAVTWAVPAVLVTDSPAFGWRGYMLDVSRHFFTTDQVKEVLDMMASQKLNRFHWHLTDDQGWRIEIKAYPKLTKVGAWRADRTNTNETISDWWGRAPLQPGEQPTYGGFYTQEEIKDIVAYAKDRNIEVIPEIDLPGHAQAAVAAYPEIGCVKALPDVATGGVFRYNTVNPGKDATYQFAEAVLDEVMDLFPYDYVHIGGDECNKEQWQVDPDAQRKMREEGLASEEELQSYFITRMEQIINARGKTMIGWDEILEGGLAPNAVVMSWRGEAGGIAAAKANHEVIMTPNKYCYLDLKQGHDDLEPNLGYSKMHLSSAYNYQVIPAGFTPEQARLIKGIQANMWTESISDWGKFTYMNYPRIYAVAENAWTRQPYQDWDSFIERVLYNQQRLDAKGIRYAVSAFSPWLHHERRNDQLEIRLTTEANNVMIRYTLDSSQPDTTSTVYTEPFLLSAGQQVTAQSFYNSSPVGYPVSLPLPIHAAANRPVRERGKQALPKLTNLQYARLTPVDTNWHKFPGNTAEFTIDLEEPTTVSSLKFNTLRYTISAIYPPHSVQVWGAGSDGKYRELAAAYPTEIAAQQGRNKVPTTLEFDAVELTSLRFKLTAYDRIPEGHHRAGGRARIYLDEVVVE
ncbi:MAG: family 20 glycosylhydrolase, partial [Bacteroidota bacterium]